MNRLISVVFVFVIMLIAAAPVSAQVGDTILCNPSTGVGTNDIPLSANAEAAQTFTAPETFTLTAVKLPLQRISSPSGTFTVRITDTTTEGEVSALGDLNPSVDTDVVHSSVTLSKMLLPEATGTSADQNLSCDPDNDIGYMVELTTPVVLSEGVVYAIVADATSTPGNVQWAIVTSPDSLADGQAGTNTVSFDEGVPEEWGLAYGAETDSGFALYSNIITPVDPFTIDSGFREYLSRIGLNDVNGKTLFFGIVFAALSMIMMLNGVKGYITMGFIFLVMTVFAGEEYITPTIYLGTILMMFVGAAVGWIILRSKGESA